MRRLRDVFTPVILDAQMLNQAIGAGFGDFEDAIQYHSALRAEADTLITRNVSDYPRSKLLIVTPSEFLAARAANCSSTPASRRR